MGLELDKKCKNLQVVVKFHQLEVKKQKKQQSLKTLAFTSIMYTKCQALLCGTIGTHDRLPQGQPPSFKRFS